MRNSLAIFDINAVGNKMARASFRTENPSKVYTQTVDFMIPNAPTAIAIMDMLGLQLFAVREATKKHKELIGRYTFMVPETVAIRMFQAQKIEKAHGDLVSGLFLNWMNRPEYIHNKENIWYNAISGLVAELKDWFDMKDQGMSLNFINSRTLYRWQLNDNPENPVLHNNMEIEFSNGISPEGVTCTENNFLSGKFKVTSTIIRDRNGNQRESFYVPRMIQYQTVETGERSHMTTTALAAEDPKKFAPVTESGVWVINAIKLRQETAKLLPRLGVVDTMTATQVSQKDAIQF